VLGPRFLEGDADGVVSSTFLAPDDHTWRVSSPARADRREEQDERLGRLDGFLRSGPHAASRKVKNMQPDHPSRIVLGGISTHRLHRHTDDAARVPASFPWGRRRFAHGLLPRTKACASGTAARDTQPLVASPVLYAS